MIDTEPLPITNSGPQPDRTFSLLLNVGGLLVACFPLLTLLFSDHHGLVTAHHCLAAAGLAATLLFLPDALARRGGNGWFNSPAGHTILVLSVLVFLGWLALPGGVGAWLLMALGLTSLVFTQWRIPRSEDKWQNPLLGLLLLALLLFCYLRIYHSGYAFWMFTEALTAGNAHIDTVFHAAIAESITQLGVPSTSLDGSPLYHYHWGSHLVFGQLGRLIGCGSLGFYNLFYPVLAVPLFIKFTWLLYQALFPATAASGRGRLTFVPAILLFLMLPLRVTQTGHPFLGESNLLALLLAFSHAVLLLRFIRKIQPTRADYYRLIGLSFLYCTLISFCKVSVGFCWTGALFLLLLLRMPQRYWPAAVVLGGLLGTLVLWYIFPVARGFNATDGVRLSRRYINFVDFGGGFYYFFWVPLVLIFNQLARPLNKLDWRRGNRSGIILVLSFTWVLGLSAAVISSNSVSDVLYFQMVSFFLSLPWWIYLLDKLAENLQRRRLLIVVGSVMVIGFFITSQLYDGLIWNAKKYVVAHSKDGTMQHRSELLDRLAAYFPERAAGDLIFVPPTETWFYRDNEKPIKTSFAVPALTGTPLLWGIPDSLLSSNYKYYSLIHYRPAPADADRTPAAAFEEARRRGAKRLIVFRVINGKLREERVEL